MCNDALRVIAAEQMSSTNQTQMQELMERHNQKELNSDELSLLEALVERGEQLMLRKAEAVTILVSRGVTDSPDQ